jgi:protein-S-isoprenylcysteine O-methyltransferase Ste14
MLPDPLTAAWAIAAVYATIPAYWFAVHPFTAFWQRRRRSPFRVLLPLWIILIAGLMAVSAPWRWLRFYDLWWTWLVALSFFAAGLGIYARAFRPFGRFRLTGEVQLRPREHPQELITSGLHGRVRHPIYLGHLLNLTGLTLGSGLVVLCGFWLLAVITGALMLRLEERELLVRFGPAYRDYQRRVPLLVPRW